jgi:hypothetical protein
MKICLILASRAFQRALADTLSALGDHSLTMLFPQRGKSPADYVREIEVSNPDVLMLQHTFLADFNGEDIAKEYTSMKVCLIGLDYQVVQRYCHWQYGDTLKLAQAHHRGEETADDYLSLAQKLLDTLPKNREKLKFVGHVRIV